MIFKINIISLKEYFDRFSVSKEAIHDNFDKRHAANNERHL